ncbi:MAG: hypothetical protein KGD63_01560 [Candidatus Lokiarchaeota archaeon]|nr:hypothetical protein [Candidatus Lokiarchaeota archaeon]
MTIYELSIISTTGFPYYNKTLKPLPKGVDVFLRFFDFSNIIGERIPDDAPELMFDLKAGLISALFEFARNIDKRIKILEFRPKSPEESTDADLIQKEESPIGDVIITTTTESYLLHNQIRKKINLIHNEFISSRLPLDSAYEIPNIDQTNIIDILIDKKARDHIKKKEKQLNTRALELLDDWGEYGLRGIVCASFDLSPIICFSKGNKYLLEDIDKILREIGNIPDIESYEWDYRQSLHNNKPMWVFIINSGAGVTVKEVFEPYYYLLLADPNSYVGEFPTKLITEFNQIIN